MQNNIKYKIFFIYKVKNTNLNIKNGLRESSGSVQLYFEIKLLSIQFIILSFILKFSFSIQFIQFIFHIVQTDNLATIIIMLQKINSSMLRNLCNIVNRGKGYFLQKY